MGRNRLKIVLVAGESAGVKLLRALHPLPHDIVAVLAVDDSRQSLGPSVADMARNLGIMALPADHARKPDFARFLILHGVDILLSVRSPHVLPEPVLKAPGIGAFNLHTGPLPQYPGLNAVSWAIRNGASEHGVTLHRMTPEVDAGDVVYAVRFPIEPEDSAVRVTGRCVALGIPLCLHLVEQAAVDPEGLPRLPQDRDQRIVRPAIPPDAGRVDVNSRALDVVNLVRACDFFPHPSPWPIPRTVLEGREVGLTRAALTGQPSLGQGGSLRWTEDGRLYLACRDEWIEILGIELEGMRCLPAILANKG